MKYLERNILPFQEKELFAPIRDKSDYCRVVIQAVRILLLENNDKRICTGKIKVIVDQMSRIFFYSEAKYYSVMFPFLLTKNASGEHDIKNHAGIILTHKIISSILSIIGSEQFINKPSLLFYYQEPEDYDYETMCILEELMHCEPSYIRYDYDPVYEKGRIHPLFHFDINYSQNSQYKIGLYKGISSDYFEDIQNTNSECRYLEE